MPSREWKAATLALGGFLGGVVSVLAHAPWWVLTLITVAYGGIVIGYVRRIRSENTSRRERMEFFDRLTAEGAVYLEPQLEWGSSGSTAAWWTSFEYWVTTTAREIESRYSRAEAVAFGDVPTGRDPMRRIRGHLRNLEKLRQRGPS